MLGDTLLKTITIYVLLATLTVAFIYGQLKDFTILSIIGAFSIFIYYKWIKKIYLHLTSKVELGEEYVKSIIKDKFTEIKLINQEEAQIKYKDIHYVYFAEAELRNILFIKDKVSKVKIINNEQDYSPNNLIQKYKISRKLVAQIMDTKGIVFNENNSIEFIELIEELREKYNISIYKILDIERAIKNKTNITYEFILNIFAEDELKKKDILRIKKYFNQNEHGILIPYTKTKIDIDTYEKYDKDIFESKGKIDWTLVLSNEDGSNKVYIPNFFKYKKKDQEHILEKIKKRTKAKILFQKDILEIK